ncbi:MAG: ABC-F family ATP-binding cassette domain-containing protein [Bacteroidales bacterium]|nr:ABC-F family ATP-binding cassette domain-containing protein [Bacteroidales bacterium]
MAVLTPYLQADQLTKSVGDKVLFRNLSFGIAEGQRVALVARNGAGKSTLLDILTGNGEADSGTITFRKDLRVGYLPQRPYFDKDMSVADVCAQHKDGAEMRRVLTQLKITDLGQNVHTLSGGQQKRVALAAVLADLPDLLLLDEPTNHLDLDMVEWLEKRLQRAGVTLLMVTHDRYFLDRVCSDIIEIDQQQLFAYHGNYAYYLDKRAARMEAFDAETEKYRNLYRTELEWMHRMPQARGHKAQYRIDNFKQIEERATESWRNEQMRLEVQSTYIGSKIFEAKSVSKAYGDRIILQDFNYTFARYERLGIIGNNGTGKSTFLKMLLGIEQPDKGRFDIGETVRFGYYSQAGLPEYAGKKVIDIVRDIAEFIDLGNGKRLSASQFLQHFLFSPQQQYDYADKLSGGERQRLYLCTVLLQNPNFLVLDEPTNDLDIPTLNILEEWLRQFKGCLIVVSHDRYFMDKVVEHLFVFHGQGNIQDFPGNYTQYREQRDSQAVASEETEQRRASSQSKPRLNDDKKPRRLSYKEQQELQALEQELPLLEDEKKALEQRLSGETLTADEVARLSARYQEVQNLLDEKEMRWLELSEI